MLDADATNRKTASSSSALIWYVGSVTELSDSSLSQRDIEKQGTSAVSKGMILPGMNVCGMEHDQIDRQAAGVAGEVENEILVEAAGREVHRSAVRAAPVRARTRRCPVRARDRYCLAHDGGELLAYRTLEHLGCDIDQAHVLSIQGQNEQRKRLPSSGVDVVPFTVMAHGA